MMNNKQEIVKIFVELQKQIKQNITTIQLITPIKIKENLYINGIRNITVTNTEIKLLNIHNNENIEMWVSTDIIQNDLLTLIIYNIKQQIIQILQENYTILIIQYREHTQKNTDYVTHEEIILFQNKNIAIKETIKIRRKYLQTKTKFIHKNIITDEEFAEKELM